MDVYKLHCTSGLSVMIEKLIIKFGSAKNAEPLTVNVTPVTLFVGPNNSGKSQFLIEIENYCRTTQGRVTDILLETIQFTAYTKDDIEKELKDIEQTPTAGEVVQPGHIVIGKVNPQNNQAARVNIQRDNLIQEAQTPNVRRGFYAQFLNLYTVRLDGLSRLNLLTEQNAGDLLHTPTNHLARLFIENGLREQVRRIVFDAFSRYFVIDPTNIGKLRVRLAHRAPLDETEEKGWGNTSIQFHKDAIDIRTASDGVRAFAGIITAIIAGDPKIILIDEPEAFLHPSLAGKLGKEISQLLRQTHKRFFASTHSASFLMGCIQSGVHLNIVRLTYNYNNPTARLLPTDKILPLMRHPLLRSSGVLSALFYDVVVVSEADADRAFYQEINERLLAEGSGRGIGGCLFINAQNKQTVWNIVKPLRELGIPVVGIVDIDILKDGGQEWTKVLDGAFIPESIHPALHVFRQNVLKDLIDTGMDIKRSGGISILDGSKREAAQNLIEQLRDYGVFIVPGGELESWLKPLHAAGHGPQWLMDIFQKMGEDPNDTSYIRPSTDDVWDFIGLIKKWAENPIRKGIPE